MKRAKALAVAFLVAFLLATPTASGQQRSAQPTNLVLEVYFYPNEPPAYVVVPPAPSRPSGAWFARFPRLPGWTTPAGSLPVVAVDIRSVLTAGVVRVWVSVILGRLHEEEKQVAVYTIREGEKITAQELAQFGVEPFKLVLSRVAPATPEVPQVLSKAKSVELVAIVPVLSTLPSYRMTLRNLSTKDVSALEIRVRQDGHILLSSMPQGDDGGSRIPAGGTSEFNERLATRAAPTPGGYEPASPANQIIEIVTAVFEDGSFEGEAEPAMTFRAFVKGCKIQVGRVVGLFQTAVQNDQNPLGALELLRKDVAALGTEADSSAVEEVANEFASPKKDSKLEIKSSAEIAMSGVRRDLLEEIQRFQLSPQTSPGSIHGWLTASKQRYETWLSRL